MGASRGPRSRHSSFRSFESPHGRPSEFQRLNAALPKRLQFRTDESLFRGLSENRRFSNNWAAAPQDRRSPACGPRLIAKHDFRTQNACSPRTNLHKSLHLLQVPSVGELLREKIQPPSNGCQNGSGSCSSALWLTVVSSLRSKHRSPDSHTWKLKRPQPDSEQLSTTSTKGLNQLNKK